MKHNSSDTKLNYKHVPCEDLIISQKEAMLNLMQENYCMVEKEQFLADLSKKQFAGLLVDDNNIIRGFTTFAVNPGGSGTDEYSILFSGDTIISPEFWGRLELMRGWCYSVAQILNSNKDHIWYWFLLSKGHRTFMYLPLFFKTYYPCLDGEPTEQKQLFDLMERLAQSVYPELYVRGSGIIQFPTEGGELKKELAQTTFDRVGKKQVDWFLKKNPGFHKGDELICISRIHPDNMNGFAKEFLARNMADNEQGSAF